MKRTIDVSTNLSTQVPPDTIDVDITIRGTSKIREDCTAKYNVLQKLLGYDFHAKLSIKQHLEEDLVEKIWKALSSCGDEVTFSVEFSIAHNDTIKDNLSVDAIVICRQKANLLAHAAGAKVVGLKHADYDFNGRELAYKACDHIAFCESDYGNQVPTFDSSDIDICCYVSTSWDIELLPPDDLL
ncbi:MAG: SIMPL domain-containing protein [Atopobium sp.]|nr:SIMPL domain-containing protein [Atopobium sp.]